MIYYDIREEELKLSGLQRLPLLSDPKPQKVSFRWFFCEFSVQRQERRRMTRKEKMERGWSIQPPDQAKTWPLFSLLKLGHFPIITLLKNFWTTNKEKLKVLANLGSGARKSFSTGAPPSNLPRQPYSTDWSERPGFPLWMRIEARQIF